MTASTDQTMGPEYPAESATERVCDAPDCRQPGLYRAPMSRACVRNYYHFCLEHVRAYNLAWDYYKNMNEAEVEAERRHDTVWRRPSWRMGSSPTPGAGGSWTAFQDPFGIFEDLGPGAKDETAHPAPSDPKAEACAVLGVPPDADPLAIKARYKILVKALHPDRAGGDPDTLERMKQVNQAYQTLKKCFTR